MKRIHNLKNLKLHHDFPDSYEYKAQDFLNSLRLL